MRHSLACALVLLLAVVPTRAQATYQNEIGATLRWLDKVTARTGVVELHKDETAKYGDLVIRIKDCRTQDPLEGADSAAFVQVWESKPDQDPAWVYSGWMFSAAPGMAAMDHPVYDVWVLGCIGRVAAPAQTSQDVVAKPAIEAEEGNEESIQDSFEDIVDENASAADETTDEEQVVEDDIDDQTETVSPQPENPYDAPYDGYRNIQTP